MAKLDYNSINFRNKDIDKMAGKFGNGDPLKTKSVQDSTMMSRGYTPLESGMYGTPLTKEEASMNKAAAAKSNPSKTGQSPDYSKSQAKRKSEQAKDKEMMSRGYTPIQDEKYGKMYKRPNSKAEMEANKKNANKK